MKVNNGKEVIFSDGRHELVPDSLHWYLTRINKSTQIIYSCHLLFFFSFLKNNFVGSSFFNFINHRRIIKPNIRYIHIKHGARAFGICFRNIHHILQWALNLTYFGCKIGQQFKKRQNKSLKTYSAKQKRLIRKNTICLNTGLICFSSLFHKLSQK